MLLNTIIIVILSLLKVNVCSLESNNQLSPNYSTKDVTNSNGTATPKPKRRRGAHWTGSKIGTTDYNMESKVIHKGKDDYMKLIAKPRKSLLCATFVRADINPIITLTSNIYYAKDHCDWAIVIYDGKPSYEDKICKDLKEKNKNIVFCSRSKHALINNKNNNSNTNLININETIKSVPKTVLYFDLLPIIPLYNVRLIDFIIIIDQIYIYYFTYYLIHRDYFF
jgi:hypothetical protein